VESMTKRGWLFLEDADWKRANEYFDKALDTDPEYASAHAGKLCAELNIRQEGQLPESAKAFADNGHFQKAVRFADKDYRARLEGYEKSRIERLQREQYDKLVAAMGSASTEEQYRDLAKQFGALGGYDKANELMADCVESACKVRYRLLGKMAKEAKTEEDYKKLTVAFREMNGYRNTGQLAQTCEDRYLALKERREEQERKQEEQAKEIQYAKLVKYMEKASNNSDVPELKKTAELFRKMNGYKDSEAKADESDYLAKEITYDKLVLQMENVTKYNLGPMAESLGAQRKGMMEKLEYLACQFRELEGFEDSAALADKCDKTRERYALTDAIVGKIVYTLAIIIIVLLIIIRLVFLLLGE